MRKYLIAPRILTLLTLTNYYGKMSFSLQKDYCYKSPISFSIVMKLLENTGIFIETKRNSNGEKVYVFSELGKEFYRIVSKLNRGKKAKN